MPASPLCEVKNGGAAYVPTTNGVRVTPGNVVVIRLLSQAGVDAWTCTCISVDDSSNAAAVNAGVVIDSVQKTATFTAPAAGKAYRFQSRVIEAGKSLTTTFAIYTEINARIVHALDETFESNAAQGWAANFNGLIRDVIELPEDFVSGDLLLGAEGGTLVRIPKPVDTTVARVLTWGIAATGPTWEEASVAPPPAPAFDPTTVSGLLVWYDLSQNSNSGGLLTALPDQSGTGRNGIITAGQEPTFNASNGAFNGQPTMTFPASNTKRVSVPSLGLTTGPYTIVMVSSMGVAGSAYACSANDGNDAAQVSSSSGAVAFSSQFSPGSLQLTDGNALVPNVIVAVGDGASSKLYVSKKTPGISATGNAGTHDLTGNTHALGNYLNSIDGAFSQAGATAHWLVYSGALTQGQVESLLDGFGAECGIAIGA